jgi:DNA-binding SARP family transcriptional activator
VSDGSADGSHGFGLRARGAASPAALRVRVLGGLTVEGVGDSQLGSRKARTLLKALAVSGGRPVSLDALTDAVWPDQPPGKPHDQLGVLASRLRRVLGSERLVRTDAGLALAADWLDLTELSTLVAEASNALSAGRTLAARVSASAALDLARGPLLPDEEGEWIEAPRARAAGLIARARELAATAALEAGDPAGAALIAQDALTADPFDEHALRVLMRAHAGAGRPAAALAAYARVRQHLAEELGVSPDRETEAIHSAILLGTFQTPAAAAEEVGTLVGRERELGELDAHRRAAVTDGVRVVVLEGEAGVGKTALASAFAAHARREGDRVVIARVDELGRDLPLQPVLDALGEEVTGSARLDAAAVHDTDLARAEWFESVLSAVAPAGVHTLLIVDDVHWSDSTTRSWLTWAVRRPRPLLVVASARPPTALPGAVVMPVAVLDGRAIDELVGSMADPSRAATIRERSGGNPLFALALAASPGDELPHSVQGRYAPRSRRWTIALPISPALQRCSTPPTTSSCSAPLPARRRSTSSTGSNGRASPGCWSSATTGSRFGTRSFAKRWPNRSAPPARRCSTARRHARSS